MSDLMNHLPELALLLLYLVSIAIWVISLINLIILKRENREEFDALKDEMKVLRGEIENNKERGDDA